MVTLPMALDSFHTIWVQNKTTNETKIDYKIDLKNGNLCDEHLDVCEIFFEVILKKIEAEDVILFCNMLFPFVSCGRTVVWFSG